MIASTAKLYENQIHRIDPVGLRNDNYANRAIGARQSSNNGITAGDDGGSLTFTVRATGDSDASSPRLWKMSPPPEPMSPNSRTQAIERGQRELMEMIKDLPESLFELSLRDIVDQNSSNQICPLADRDSAESDDEKRPVLMADPRKKKKAKKTMAKSRSFDNGGYLLKTSVFPIWFGLKRSKRKQKKKVLFSSGSLKAGPTPATVAPEKEWLRRKSSEERDSSSGGLSSSNSGSSSRSSSRSSSTSTSSRQGQSNKFLLGCCSFRKN